MRAVIGKKKCKVIENPSQQHHLTIVVKPSTEQPDEWTVKGNTLDVFSPGYPLNIKLKPGNEDFDGDLKDFGMDWLS